MYSLIFDGNEALPLVSFSPKIKIWMSEFTNCSTRNTQITYIYIYSIYILHISCALIPYLHKSWGSLGEANLIIVTILGTVSESGQGCWKRLPNIVWRAANASERIPVAHCQVPKLPGTSRGLPVISAQISVVFVTLLILLLSRN